MPEPKKYRYRSALTGKFISHEEFERADPATVIRSEIKPRFTGSLL